MATGNKKLLNETSKCVDECLFGLTTSHPHLALHPRHRVVIDADVSPERKVGIVSGGGSGHEPFPAGYVGAGMLTAAVCGSVFASPPSSNILYAIREVSKTSPGGVLVLIPNYTGDRLNFGLAVETAKAEGLQVDSLVVGDDIAQCVDEGPSPGRRGMVGIVAVFKVAGNVALLGGDLQAVKGAATLVSGDAASLGLALGSSTLPGASQPLFQLASDEIELGVGVHGEAGIRTIQLSTAQSVVGLCLDHLVKFLKLDSEDRAIVLVNNLGALSQLEQWIVAGEIHKQLAQRGITVLRLYSAPLFTSINMSGVQICLLRIKQESETFYLNALDSPTTAPSWPRHTPRSHCPKVREEAQAPIFTKRGPKVNSDNVAQIQTCLKSVNFSLIKHEEKLNVLDSGCGDGDCGTTLRNLAVGIDAKADGGELTFTHPATLALQLASVAATTMGGTSGAIYSLLLTEAAKELERQPDLSSPVAWARAWRAGLRGIQKYSSARVGDRTMFDAMEPALDVFEQELAKTGNSKESIEKAVLAAVKGSNKTAKMIAKAGRASYVEAGRVVGEDAGAFAVTVWLTAISEALRTHD